jgi:hypothetical protein
MSISMQMITIVFTLCVTSTVLSRLFLGQYLWKGMTLYQNTDLKLGKNILEYLKLWGILQLKRMKRGNSFTTQFFCDKLCIIPWRYMEVQLHAFLISVLDGCESHFLDRVQWHDDTLKFSYFVWRLQCKTKETRYF